jgi:hypothetical protein
MVSSHLGGMVVFLLIIQMTFAVVLTYMGSILGAESPIDINNPDAVEYEMGYGFGEAVISVLFWDIVGVPFFINILFWIFRIAWIYILVEVLWIG